MRRGDRRARAGATSGWGRPVASGDLALLSEVDEALLVVEVFAAQGRSNTATAQRLVAAGKTVESHIASIFSKLGLYEAPDDDHRRVLAVLAALRRA